MQEVFKDKEEHIQLQIVSVIQTTLVASTPIGRLHTLVTSTTCKLNFSTPTKVMEEEFTLTTLIGHIPKEIAIINTQDNKMIHTLLVYQYHLECKL